MIKEIHYKNFKALRDTTLPLGRFTLIVGANGTGKTTAIDALKIVSNLTLFSGNDIASANNQDSLVEIALNLSEMDYPFPFSVTARWRENGKGKFDFEEQESRNDWTEDIERDAIKYIERFRKFDFDSDKIAEPVGVVPNIKLEENGGNLAGVLLQIQNAESEAFEQLNRELQNWFPEFDRITFEIPEKGKISFLLRTKVGKYKIKAKDLSDGTRLALAYLTIAYLPNPPKIVAFEEPEKGIHPRLLENIQEAMYRLSYPENYGEKREPVQVIATTHSPYLLDLYKDYPEEIVISSKDENGVHFERLIDKPHYEEIVQDAPLGEVWFTGVLGGVPVQP